MFEEGKELSNGEKLWFAAVVGFIAFGVTSLACTNPFIGSVETMKWLLVASILTYPIGCVIGWRYATAINNWMGRSSG